MKFGDKSNNNIDNYGKNVPKPQSYILRNYLEKLNDNKKVLHIKELKKCFYLQIKYFVSSRWVKINPY